jgi:acyl transferase domain-containing protein
MEKYMKNIVFIFGGQGSQYYNMARELYESDDVFRDCIVDMDLKYKEIAKYGVVDEIFRKDKRRGVELKELKYSHPSIFMIEYALSETLKKKGICPNAVIGVSLGEYTAAVLAGCFNYITALECIAKQVELLLSIHTHGCMITILEDPDLYYSIDILNQHSTLVAVNYDKHFVVSCSIKAVELIEEVLSEKKVFFIKLPVNYGFHSSLINEIEIPYKEYLSTYEFKRPSIPLILSSRKREVETLNSEYLWDSISGPMYFKEAILSTMKNECFYIDLTPGSTMKNIGVKIFNDEERDNIQGIITPFGNELKNIQTIQRII